MTKVTAPTRRETVKRVQKENPVPATYVPNPLSPSKIRELEKKITAVPEPEKVEVPTKTN